MTVLLLQSHGEESDNTVEEVVISRSNPLSQNLPPIGTNVLVAFDSVGDAYFLTTVPTDGTPLPAISKPENIITANEKIKAELTPLGGFKVTNETEEIVSLLSDLITEISVSTVASGGGALLNATKIAAYVARLATFKV